MVREITGWEGSMVRSMLWCSPNCHTYSTADAINRGRGCCYRDHSKEEKPPIDTTSKYGKAAMLADIQVQKVLDIV